MPQLHEPKVITLSDFKALVEKDERAPADVVLRKAFLPEIKAVADDERGIQFSISSAAVDRDRDTLAVEGWQLANYRKNPVVQWAHDYKSLPVARATKVFTEDNKLKAIDHFVERDVYPFADTVLQMVKHRYLNATSVGFLPIKYQRVDPESEQGPERAGGIDFTKHELLEHSVVPVPSNPEALVEARAILRGADWLAYTKEIERLLDIAHDGQLLLVPRASLEAAWKLLSPSTSATVSGTRATARKDPPADDDGDDDTSDLPATLSMHCAQLAALNAGMVASLEPLGNAGPVKDLVSTLQNFHARKAAVYASMSARLNPLKEGGPAVQPTPVPQFNTLAAILTAAAELDLADPTHVLAWVAAFARLRGVIPYHHTPLAAEGEAWDAGTEVGAADVDGLKVMCAWYGDDGKSKGDYKLPHHKGSGTHACVWRGVAAAAGRLGQTQIPAADKKGVRTHLAGHYKDFGKDAPWKAAPEAWAAYEAHVTAQTKAAGTELADDALATLLVVHGFAGEATALRGGGAPDALDQLLASLPAVADPNTLDLGDGVTVGVAELSAAIASAAGEVTEAAIRRLTGKLD